MTAYRGGRGVGRGRRGNIAGEERELSEFSVPGDVRRVCGAGAEHRGRWREQKGFRRLCA